MHNCTWVHVPSCITFHVNRLHKSHVGNFKHNAWLCTQGMHACVCHYGNCLFIRQYCAIWDLYPISPVCIYLMPFWGFYDVKNMYAMMNTNEAYAWIICNVSLGFLSYFAIWIFVNVVIVMFGVFGY